MTILSDKVSERLKRTLFSCLEESGDILKKRFGKTMSIRKKGPVNLVTEMDTASEKKIISLIHKSFPDHGILAEESAPQRGNSPFRWVIDPIDGTTNYAHGIPLCCISMGIELEGELILGGIFNPFLNELFFAEKGKGAFLNRKRVRVSEQSLLAESLLVTGFPYDRQEKADYYLKFFKRVMQRSQGLRRLGAAALDLAYVACGRFEAFWEFNLKPWDIAAGTLIVQEAGGHVSDFKGRPIRIDHPTQILASNGAIHAELLKVLDVS